MATAAPWPAPAAAVAAFAAALAAASERPVKERIARVLRPTPAGRSGCQVARNWLLGLTRGGSRADDAGAVSVDQPIGVWNTSVVTDMRSTFSGASSFDRDL